ncbi:MAG: hypothetical protein ACJATA_000876 [Sphingobacteriales bacterium]|jgi:hypothetical protein
MKRIILIKAISQENSSNSKAGKSLTMTHHDVQKTHDLAHFINDSNLQPDNIVSGGDYNVLFTSFILARELGVDFFNIKKVVYSGGGVLKPLETIATQYSYDNSVLLVVENSLFKEILTHYVLNIDEVSLFSEQMLFLNFSCDNWPETLYSQPHIIPGNLDNYNSERKDIA